DCGRWRTGQGAGVGESPGRSGGQGAAARTTRRAAGARIATQSPTAVNRLAIFDCDGTLVDSGATIYAALSETFRQNGLELPPPEISRRVIGLSLIEAMAALLPDASAEEHVRFAEDYKRAFWRLRAAGQVEEPLFDGVLELLDRLEENDWLLA